MSQPSEVTAFAPATVANVGVGFDILGFSLPVIGDEVTVTRVPEKGALTIGTVKSHGGFVSAEDLAAIPKAPEKNTATVALRHLLNDLSPDFGFRVSVSKGIPLASGMGGSAASAVGALLAASPFFSPPLGRETMLRFAGLGEAAASGAVHLDNIAPCLYGGLTLVRSHAPADIVPLRVPQGILAILVHPHTRVSTREARAVLKPSVSLTDHIRQSANLAAFVAACYTNDPLLLARCLVDTVIEPQRASLIPGFPEVKAAALGAGALGCSIGGAGPSVFAWADTEAKARAARDGMAAAFLRKGLQSDAWITPLTAQGARVVSLKE